MWRQASEVNQVRGCQGKLAGKTTRASPRRFEIIGRSRYGTNERDESTTGTDDETIHKRLLHGPT